ncbi:MAG: DNA polymerase III subunit delta [Geobacteraceae bacterium]|nr:DNA polymerase III subunit delta [Geobacteraceae bacterium]
MKYQELMHALDKGDVRPLLYFHGDEPYLMEKAVRRLLDTLVPPDLRDFNLEVFYGNENSGGQIVEAAATLPMFAEWRVVLVKKADALPAASLEDLARYIENPSPSTCLVFLAEKIDQRKKFFTEFKKRGELVECKRLYENQLGAFIKAEAAARGKRIESAAAEMLVYLVGNNLQELVSEVEKAVLYVGDRDMVTAPDIREIASDTRVNSVFELADSLGEKKIDRALRSLDTLIEGGEAPLLVLAMITRHYRQLWKVRELLDRKTPTRDISKEAGINPYFLQGIIPQARNYEPGELRRLFEKIFQADLALKTGRVKPRIVLERLLMDACGKL